MSSLRAVRGRSMGGLPLRNLKKHITCSWGSVPSAEKCRGCNPWYPMSMNERKLWLILFSRDQLKFLLSFTSWRRKERTFNLAYRYVRDLQQVKRQGSAWRALRLVNWGITPQRQATPDLFERQSPGVRGWENTGYPADAPKTDIEGDEEQGVWDLPQPALQLSAAHAWPPIFRIF